MTELTMALDGTGLEYTYDDGGTLKVAFHGGLIDYRWISGVFEGTTVKDLPYQAREIVDGVYLVNFHVTSENNFGTLVIDLKGQAVMSSALVDYKSDEPITLFDFAKINKITGRDV